MGKNADRQKLLENEARTTSTWPYRGKVFSVRHDAMETSEGAYTRDVCVTKGAVAVIPILDGKIVLVEQWRRSVGKITLELPAGMLDVAGEKPIDCAHRELREETGFAAKSMTPFGSCFTSPGILLEEIFFFVATDLVYHPLQGDDSHLIDVQKIPIRTAIQMVEAGEITDAKTVIGILRYR